MVLVGTCVGLLKEWPKLGCTPKGVYGNSVLRRVLRRFREGFWGRGSQKGSEKGVFNGFLQ